MIYIIADAGVNWRNLEDADKLIQDVVETGCDAIKFQAYQEKQITLHPRYKELYNIMLDESSIRYLYWRCKQHNIAFMCTPMYPEAVDMLDPYVTRWKIRYSDRKNLELINKCLNTNKNILVSTATPYQTTSRINTLYCISEYPPGIPELIGDCKGYKYLDLKGFDGYSCHIPEIDHIFDTVYYNNLEYLEVHIKPDSYDNYEPIYVRVSITLDELEELVESIRSIG